MERGSKIEGLENETDLLVPDLGQLVAIHRGNVFAVKLVMPGAGRIEAAQHVHEGRFAAAARAHDGEIFVAMNLQRHAAQRVHGLLAHHVVLRDVLDVDDDRADMASGVNCDRVTGEWQTVSHSRFTDAPIHFFFSSFSISTFAPSFNFRLMAL